MEPKLYLNGQIIDASHAKVSVFDAGFLHGASTFTTMLAHNGKVFRLGRHLDRLLQTASLLKIRTSATADQLTQAVMQVLQVNDFKRARMRITLTPGSVHEQEPTTLVTAEDLLPYPPEWYQKGVGVLISSFRQAADNPIFGNKTGCYFARLLARQEAAAKGMEEALWFTADNYLAEACFNNVFLVLEGKVYTPPLDTPVLGGIVREAILELCHKLDMPCEDSTSLTIRQLLDAQEVFLTGSTTGVRPVVRIERHAVGDEKPGQVTRRLMDAYAQLLDEECK